MNTVRRLLVAAAAAATVVIPAGLAHASGNPAPVAGPAVAITEADLPAWCADGTLTVFTGRGFTGASCIRAPYNGTPVAASTDVPYFVNGEAVVTMPAWVAKTLGL